VVEEGERGVVVRAARAKAKQVFLHVRVHGLEAAVEAREHRGTDGAVVLCDESGQRVASASPAAMGRGVRPGDSLWEAQRKCPEAMVAESADGEEKYEYFWRQVMDICGDYSPEARGERGRGISLDLTGTELLFGPAKAVGQEIRNRLRLEVGVSASVGIGPNRIVAELASELARPGEVWEVLPEEAAEFVGRMPIAVLPGVDGEWRRWFEEMGIRRARELAELPAGMVERALGEQGRRLWEIARDGSLSRGEPDQGRGSSRMESNPEGEMISAQSDLHPPTEARERISAGLRKAAEEAARRLRERGQVGRQVRIELVFRDLRAVGARRTLPQATRSGEVIFHAARDLLARMKLGGRLVRRVRVRVTRLAVGPQGGQLALPLVPREVKRERLAEMVDRVKDRFGETAVARASALRT